MASIILLLALCLASVSGQFYKVQYELRNLDTGGLLSTNKACAPRGAQCNPYVTGAIDVEDPLGVWPGSRPVSNWTKIFDKENDDEPKVGKIISKDICTKKPFTRANLRVNVMDSDKNGRSQIEQFECLTDNLNNVLSWDSSSRRNKRQSGMGSRSTSFDSRGNPTSGSFDSRDSGSRNSMLGSMNSQNRTTPWSQEKQCQAKFLPRTHSLSFRWQVVQVTEATCGRRASLGSSSRPTSNSNKGNSWDDFDVSSDDNDFGPLHPNRKPNPIRRFN